jgi:signal peptidase II
MSAQPEPSTTRPDTAEGPSWYRDWVLLATLAVAVAADQLTKLAVKTNLALGESWPAEGFLRISHGTNSGSAFGLFRGQPVVLAIASIFAIGFIVYYYRMQSARRPMARFTIGLLLGGALGNLTDRLRMGEVVDFIDVGPWPVFNLADSSIVVGMTLLVASVVLAGGGSRGDEPTDTDAHVDASPDGSGYP